MEIINMKNEKFNISNDLVKNSTTNGSKGHDKTSKYSSKSSAKKATLDQVERLNHFETGSKQTENDDDMVYCICRRRSSEDEENEVEDIMIECDVCKDWLHARCVQLTQRLIADIEIYVCPRCISDQNKIVLKKRYNYHRHDYNDAHADKKPVQAGTPAFTEQLLKRQFPDAIENGIIRKVKKGNELSFDFFVKNRFDTPILIENKEELGFIMPNADQIDLTRIEQIVGSEYSIDVIDVERQQTFPMSIKELNDYFKQVPRTKIYNLISFEISKTKLTENITAPNVVCDISWVSNGVWPRDSTSSADTQTDTYNTTTTTTTAKSNDVVKPEVQKYCLISAAKSYTDFHIDFGGSSVWYHIVKGDKVFYLIEPTNENLDIYENWNTLKNHSEIFLADRVKQCYKFDLKQGQTVFLPAGWIHAVYTPNDSLVFGGNFLQSFSIPMQIKVYEMELRMKTPEKFLFPAFETLQWYAAKYYAQMLKDFNTNQTSNYKNKNHNSFNIIDAKFMNELKYLRDTLKRWINSKEYYQLHEYEIPRRINCDKLVRIMSKELTKTDVFLKSIVLLNSNNNNLNNSGLKERMTSQATTNEYESEIQLHNNSNKNKKHKEVLNYENIDLIGIKFDDEANSTTFETTSPKQTSGDELKQEKEQVETEKRPIERIIVKIPKLKEENVNSTEKTLNHIENGLDKHEPIKIKLKLTKTVDEIVKQEVVKKNDEPEDEFIKELKNSYEDNDFVYPNVNTKKNKSSKNVANENGTHLDNPTEQNGQKSTRKRKLKPHAVQYLLPATSSSTIATDSTETQKNPSKTNYKKMVEKNMLNNQEEVNDTQDDDDFKPCDDDLDEDDEDFKLKCKNNLKLSKKLKKNLQKQQKSDETGNEKCSSDETKPNSASKESKDKSNNSNGASKQNKKFKKGFATSKQRLSKLLKLNRIVNI